MNKRNYILWVLVICSTLFLWGCSGTGSGVDKLGGRDIDVKNLIVQPQVQLIRDEEFNKHWDAETDFYFTALTSLITAAEADFLYSLDFRALDFSYDYDQLLNGGYLTIVPVNIYTKADVKQSKTYSPGDIYLRKNSTTGGEFTLHYGEGAYRFSPEFHSKAETRKTYFKDHPDKVQDAWDGFSETHYMLGIQSNEERADPAITGGFMWKSAEALKMLKMQLQLSGYFNQRAYALKMPGITLDDMIADVGRRNPNSWINPYNNEPMRDLPLYLPEHFSYSEEHGPIDLRPSMALKTVDKRKYAGNYTYLTYVTETADYGALVFYYINENGDLDTLTCSSRYGR